MAILPMHTLGFVHYYSLVLYLVAIYSLCVVVCMASEEKVSEAEEVERILRVVSGEVPRLIENIIKPLKDLLNDFYSPESVRMRAEAFVTFYKTLVENGVPEDEALKLAKTQIMDINTILERIFGSLGKL